MTSQSVNPAFIDLIFMANGGAVDQEARLCPGLFLDAVEKNLLNDRR